MEQVELIRTVTAAQNGDSDALNTLFNTFYNDVYYFALKTVKDDDLACDITQETFVEIINTLGDLKEPVAFVTWMKKITYHQCTRYFKKKKDVLVDEDEEGNTVFDTLAEDRAEFIPDEALDKEDFRKTIMEMIDKLSEEQRAVVMMFYFEELSIKQIAEIQGVSEGTVKSRLNYARKGIKASVEDYEKKNNIKLHSVAILPLLLWLFRGYFAKAMPAASAKAVAAGVSAATGTAVSVSAGTATAAAATTTATAAATATGIGAKIASIPIVAKIIAGIVAAAIVVGGGLAVADLADSLESAKCDTAGHSLQGWKVHISAGDYAPGETRNTCANCDYYESKMQYDRMFTHYAGIVEHLPFFETAQALQNDLGAVITAAVFSQGVDPVNTSGGDGRVVRSIAVSQMDAFTTQCMGATFDYTGIERIWVLHESLCYYDAATDSLQIYASGIGGGDENATREVGFTTEDHIHFTVQVTDTFQYYGGGERQNTFTFTVEATDGKYILTSHSAQ